MPSRSDHGVGVEEEHVVLVVEAGEREVDPEAESPVAAGVDVGGARLVADVTDLVVEEELSTTSTGRSPPTRSRGQRLERPPQQLRGAVRDDDDGRQPGLGGCIGGGLGRRLGMRRTPVHRDVPVGHGFPVAFGRPTESLVA